MTRPSFHRHQSGDRTDVMLSVSPVFDDAYRQLQDTVVALTAQLRREHASRLAESARADALVEEIRSLQQRNERLTAIGGSTAEFAHQARTPLASALLYAAQLTSGKYVERRIAAKIVAGLNELRRMLDDTLEFVAGTPCARENVNVRDLLEDVRTSLEGQLKCGSIVAVSVTDPNIELIVNRDAIKGALTNLVCNADQSSNDAVNVLLHGHRFGGAIHLCVSDDGPGIPADVQPRLFEPFFTTRSSGTGLGLSVVKAVTAAHDGRVEMHTSELGSSFSLQFPVLMQEAG